MRAVAIGFFNNIKNHLMALDASNWCDTYFLAPDSTVGGIAGSIKNLEELNIPFNIYDAALIFADSSAPALKYFNNKCLENNITIYANQHGFNKSILQIECGTPNDYSKYWNCMGKYFLDRYEEVMGSSAASRRWISIGSLMHDYLYRNFKWYKASNNGKVLIIHEPDLQKCEGDKYPHDSEEVTKYLIEAFTDLGIEPDLKPHPNWNNFIGNSGEALEKPAGVNIVDISLEEIKNYALIAGSRSTMLLDAASMGIPTIALESSSNWPDDKYPPVEKDGLIPVYNKTNLKNGIKERFNVTPDYNESDRNYYLGQLGTVAENYHDFICEDLSNPAKKLGNYYQRWENGISSIKNRTGSGNIIKRVGKMLLNRLLPTGKSYE